MTTSTKLKLSLTILWALIALLITTNLAEEDEGFRFVTFFTTLTLATLPLILYWLGFWISGGAYIRRPFIWFFSRLPQRTKHSSTTPIVDATPAAANNGRLWFAFLLYFSVAIGLYYYSSDSPSNGHALSFAIGDAIGTLVIPLSIAWAVSRRRKGNVAIYVALFISAAFLVYGQWDEIEDAHDVRSLRSQLANAGDRDVLSILLASPTRLGRAAKSYSDEIGGINVVLASLDDERLENSISLDTLRDQSKISDMAKIVADKLAFCQTAQAKVDDIYAKATAKHQSETNALWVGFMNGQRKSRLATDPIIHGLIGDYIDGYNALLQLYDVLERQSGKYEVPDSGTVKFENSDAANEFNSALSQFRKSMQSVAESRSQLDKHNTAAAARLKTL